MEQGRREEEAEAPWRETLAEIGDAASLRQMFGAQRALCTDEIQTHIKGVICHDHRAEGWWNANNIALIHRLYDASLTPDQKGSLSILRGEPSGTQNIFFWLERETEKKELT